MSIPHSTTRTTQIAVRLTEDEKAELKRRAWDDGMSDLSKWVRHIIDAHLHQEKQKEKAFSDYVDASGKMDGLTISASDLLRLGDEFEGGKHD